MCTWNSPCNSPTCLEAKPRTQQPHKHAALIKAWADGAEIQVLGNGNWDTICSAAGLGWYEHKQYRIKPQAPVEPDYAAICKEAHYTLGGYVGVAKAVLDAKQKYDEEVKAFNQA